MSRSDKDALFDLLAESGFYIARQKKHYVFKHPTGRVWIVPVSPSDHHAYRNNLADFKSYLLRGRVRGVFEGPKAVDPVPVPQELMEGRHNGPVRERSRGMTVERHERRMRRLRAQQAVPTITKIPASKPSGPIDIYAVGSALQKIVRCIFASYESTPQEYADKWWHCRNGCCHGWKDMDAHHRALVSAYCGRITAHIRKAEVRTQKVLLGEVKRVRAGEEVKLSNLRSELYEEYTPHMSDKAALLMSEQIAGEGIRIVQALARATRIFVSNRKYYMEDGPQEGPQPQ